LYEAAFVIADPKTSKLTKSQRGDAVPGRLRPADIRNRVLDAAYEGVLRDGFRVLTVDAVSAQTGVAKTSIYRRWPNKAAMVMDAFAFRIGPHISFPKQQDALEGIRLQMLSLARAFRGPAGTMVKALLAEAQFDQELAKAFLKNWLLPRRKAATAALQDAIQSGQLRADLSIPETLDILYGGLYYRLMTGFGAISTTYVETVFAQVLRGSQPVNTSAPSLRKRKVYRKK
jgi:AcrR family transcriptional regulator